MGTDQLIEDNHIVIDSDGKVRCSLEEPFDSDESSDVIENILEKFLSKHTFTSLENIKDGFEHLIESSIEELKTQSFGESDKLQRIINKLISAKNLIK